jgi:NAD(P)H-dependent flavin oxidoreductase YrpB (nitropropane dioxygenase family)
VEQALAAGASAAVAGTRFLLSDESDAHPDYKAKALAADRTILTELFGLSWAAPHRVVANAATDRQLKAGGGMPLTNRLINHGSSIGARYVPGAFTKRLVGRQRPGSRALTPYTPDDRMPAAYVEAGPLYAGETVGRISSLMAAADIVDALTP